MSRLPIRPNKPDLLFLTPLVPDPRGIGLAQRAALFVRALARHYRVHLHVLPVFGAPRGRVKPLRELYETFAVEPLERHEDPLFQLVRAIRDPRHRLAATIAYPRPLACRFAAERVAEGIADRYPALAALHVFRLYLAPFAARILDRAASRRPVCRLDLDDDEVETHRRLAALAGTADGDGSARFENAESTKYAALEATFLPRFDAIFAVGADAVERLARRHPSARFIEVPNAVALPPVTPAPVGRRTKTILLVGTMNYRPNEDAAVFFCNQVLPLIRMRRTEPVRFLIAGRSPSAAVLALGDVPSVEVTGEFGEVGPLYAGADLVVAPLRAGGGTRIKILEAFAHRRPVVATTAGIEGIVARDGEHLLVRDTPEDIASACVELLEAPEAAAQMARRARDLVRTTYTDSVVMAQIEALTAPHRRRDRPRPRSPAGAERRRPS